MDKINPEFAESGVTDTDAVFDAWAGSGYLDERVRYKGLNKVLNRADSKINEIIDGAPKGLADDGDNDAHVLRLYTPANTNSHPADALNIIDTSDSTKEYADLTYAKISGVKKVFAIDQAAATCEVGVFDVEALTHDSDEDLSIGLPSGGTEDWLPLSICNDGTHAYIIFIDDDASPRVYRVQSYLLSDWSVNTDWPATGVALAALDNANYGRIICATSTKLAIAQSWVNVTAGTDAGVAIHSMTDGSLLGSGAGDTTFTNAYLDEAITSDGTYVYFGVRDTVTDDIQVSSMSIASPGATGCGGLNWPSQVAYASEYLADIMCAGHLIISTYAGTSPDPTIRVHTSDNAEIGDVTIASGITDLYRIVFDGLHFWARGIRGTHRSLSKLDVVHRVSPSNATTQETEANGENYIKSYIEDIEGYASTGINSPIVFDGVDFWYTTKDDTPAMGKLFRFAKPILR